MCVKLIPFNLALATLNCGDENEAARLIGMHAKTVRRAREEEAVSGAFIANCIAAFELNRAALEAVGLRITQDQFFEHRLAGKDESEPVADYLAAVPA